MWSYSNQSWAQNVIIELCNMNLINPIIDDASEIWKKNPDEAIVGISS